MSRLAKKPIVIPAGVTVTISGQSVVVKGKNGELKHKMSRFITGKVEGTEANLDVSGNSTQAKSSWGTEAAHIRNMIAGVQTPFTKKLVVEGIGFKFTIAGKKITFSLGFSHPVVVMIPDGLTVTAEKNEITIAGMEKAAVGQFAANIRSLKEPEPYKGKGIRYSDEVVRRKQGKRAV
jgi:large subunit ribosomal protein L6